MSIQSIQRIIIYIHDPDTTRNGRFLKMRPRYLPWRNGVYRGTLWW